MAIQCSIMVYRIEVNFLSATVVVVVVFFKFHTFLTMQVGVLPEEMTASWILAVVIGNVIF